ncbi:MAG: bifunctional glutamate N-acetyltransferase/amino-acid acetyltransferase ArgJ [Solirubrobacterales bacterium]
MPPTPTELESFFRSRWVERPQHATELDPAELPRGFRAAGLACGLKPSGGPDVGLIVCDTPVSTSAARFTRNAVTAAPVVVSRRKALKELRAVVVNAGNANVSDGTRGIETADAMVEAAARSLDLDPRLVGVASTGVIGQQLDREKVVAGIERAAGQLSESGADAFADAIVTTDRWPKRASLELRLSGGVVRLCAQAKGGGMIRPDFATLLCFVETDAALDPITTDRLLADALVRSFERISVDGQMSTNDSVFFIANGASGIPVVPGSDDERLFASALDELLLAHALEIVSDGEGATRVARVLVRGPVESVEPVARAVATSPLVQTALAGADPNWGRIIQAAGAALPDAVGTPIDLSIEGVALAQASDAVELSDSQVGQVELAMRKPEVEIAIGLSDPENSAVIYFCDLGHDYVTLNAEYTT